MLNNQSLRYVILEIMENAYMLACLHVVCTWWPLWLFSFIARCSFKTELTFKKFMGRNTFVLSVIFLLGSIVKKSWPMTRFYDWSNRQWSRLHSLCFTPWLKISWPFCIPWFTLWSFHVSAWIREGNHSVFLLSRLIRASKAKAYRAA